METTDTQSQKRLEISFFQVVLISLISIPVGFMILDGGTILYFIIIPINIILWIVFIYLTVTRKNDI